MIWFYNDFHLSSGTTDKCLGRSFLSEASSNIKHPAKGTNDAKQKVKISKSEASWKEKLRHFFVRSDTAKIDSCLPLMHLPVFVLFLVWLLIISNFCIHMESLRLTSHLEFECIASLYRLLIFLQNIYVGVDSLFIMLPSIRVSRV